MKDEGGVRTFDTGATRSSDEGRLEPFDYISPRVLHIYSTYMISKAKQSDGSKRSGDNWQKGMPIPSYKQALTRHFFDWWLVTRGEQPRYDVEETSEYRILCSILFNAMGLLFEYSKPAKVRALLDVVAERIKDVPTVPQESCGEGGLAGAVLGPERRGADFRFPSTPDLPRPMGMHEGDEAGIES